MNKSLIVLALAGFALAASAKIPPPQLDEAAKAKAAETAAKTAWQAKYDAWQTCKVQDKIAAKYGKGGAKPMQVAAKPPAAPASGAASGTPVSAAPLAPCMDPGPFAFNQPAQKPLETSGAHSPAGNATSPPSVKQEAAKIQPSGKAAKQ
ncbi:hypothetical protein [Ramlibacter sp. PS4R-6]|uniref:hypothetical protein n=1 Tax=Ramlibacter sp. PS4R-6 TaxID=3133438 RepID=UPI0030AD53BA